MGGGSKSESTSYSGSGQLWAQPLARQGVNAVNNVFNTNQPGLQNLTNIAQNQAVPQLLQQFKASQPLADQASGYNSDVLSGKYLNAGNPYTQGILDQLDRGVRDQVASQFAGAGRYGPNAAMTDVLSRNLADANSQVLFNNYTNERNQQTQAAQQGNATNVANAGLLQAMLGTGAQLPYTGSNSLANSLGALFSGGTEHNVQTSPSPIWGALGAGLGAFGSIFQGSGSFSDRRLKTNIELLHRDPDGLGWYSWNWKSDPKGPKAKGVIADEVKELRPQAYIPNYRGTPYDGVNYAAL